MGEAHSTLKPRRTGEVYTVTRRALQIGQAVHDARTARGWSQRQLAEQAGVRQATVSKIETAEALPTIDTLERLATALDLELGISLTPKTGS